MELSPTAGSLRPIDGRREPAVSFDPTEAEERTEMKLETDIPKGFKPVPAPVEPVHDHTALIGAIALSLLAALALVGFLRFARGFLIPVVLGICLAYLLSSPVALLRRWTRLPHGFAVAAVLLSAFVAIGFSVAAVYGEVVRFGSRSSEYRERLVELVDGALAPIRKVESAADDLAPAPSAETAPAVDPHTGDTLPPGAVKERPVNVRVVKEKAELPQLLTFAGGAAALAEDAAVSIFVAVLALSGWTAIRRKLLRLAGTEKHAATLTVLAGIHDGLRGYLWGTFLLSLIVAVGTGIILLPFGVPYILLWSLWGGLLTFVPYIGVPVAILPVLLVAYVNGSTASEIALLSTIYFVFRAIEGQYICSLLLSRHVDINPLAVLVAMLFWGWLWGPFGLVIAVPMTMALIVVCDRIPAFAFISELLGGEHRCPAVIVPTDRPSIIV